ncbi:CLUMA_CG018278, isoform A, partial [Clunio marinus]
MRHDVKVEDIMSWRDFEVSCMRFKLVPLVQQAIFWSLTNLPEDFLPNLLTNDEQKYMDICFKNRDETALHFMETDEFYRTT